MKPTVPQKVPYTTGFIVPPKIMRNLAFFIIVFFSGPQLRKMMEMIEQNPEYDRTRCSKDAKAWATLARVLNNMAQTDGKHAVKTAEKWQKVCFLHNILAPLTQFIFFFSPTEG